jgi:hypothetical protein
MLGLVTWGEVWDVVNFAKDRDSDWFLEGPIKRFVKTYQIRPGFFTPYRDVRHFLGGAIAPVVYPTALTFFSAMAAVCAAIGSTLGVGCLLIGAGSALFGQHELCDESIENTSIAFKIAGLALVAIAISTFLIAVSLFHAPLSFLTRSGASLVSVPNSCLSCSSAEKDDDTEMRIYAAKL